MNNDREMKNEKVEMVLVPELCNLDLGKPVIDCTGEDYSDWSKLTDIDKEERKKELIETMQEIKKVSQEYLLIGRLFRKAKKTQAWYALGYYSFESLCEALYHKGRSYVQRMIYASEVVDILAEAKVSQFPSTESQCRELAKLKDANQEYRKKEIIDVWQAALKSTRITAATIGNIIVTKNYITIDQILKTHNRPKPPVVADYSEDNAIKAENEQRKNTSAYCCNFRCQIEDAKVEELALNTEMPAMLRALADKIEAVQKEIEAKAAEQARKEKESENVPF